MVSQAAMRSQRVVESECRCWNPAVWLLVSLLGTLILVVIGVLLRFGDVKINKRALYNHGGQTSTGTQYQVRLVNGETRCQGRLEVLYNGQWGTVCDDEWDIVNAKVVCQQLHCGMAVHGKSFGQGKGSILLDNVKCKGNEMALSECRNVGWGNHNCYHFEDVSVTCKEPTNMAGRGFGNYTSPTSQSSLRDGSIRLVDGKHACEGRVEIYYRGKWGTVCDDMWSLKNAMVVCKQLGCGDAISAHTNAYFKRGTGPIHLDNVDCKGHELELSTCESGGWKVHNCGHHEDAGVTCHGFSTPEDPVSTEYQTETYTTEATESTSVTTSPTTKSVTRTTKAAPPPVRLMDGDHRCMGRVEVQYKNEWRTVCDDNWNILNAKVVCRQLGCGKAIAAMPGPVFSQGSGQILMDNVDCRGNERAITDCDFPGWGLHNCGHPEDAGVICEESESTTPRSPTTVTVGETEVITYGQPMGRSTGEGMLRLVGGRDRCEGRVEMYLNYAWGTVCDDAWDQRDAQVVCRQMGCGEVLEVWNEAFFGQGTGAILLDNLKCIGTEESLLQCSHIGRDVHNCDHSEDAGVTCSLL
ncbi:scavenger receptor cysteine-rich domain-containing group B protein-like [Solea senegalensis]|uniref:Scavenger receptor cysteine-rich domain-containing group B protein-like n=1 Tax=Solea senegalensis TaxID=28829 RepID=A0AAV6SIL4_SOLSE|nr:scavenger receptor cysteine-rich domain-containing group B protein [Solea senegalensis]KAG7516091.1 scavenger receptor cysteine-rich domain-containing group B protein-like [Solea senegalensis]